MTQILPSSKITGGGIDVGTNKLPPVLNERQPLLHLYQVCFSSWNKLFRLTLQYTYSKLCNSNICTVTHNILHYTRTHITLHAWHNTPAGTTLHNTTHYTHTLTTLYTHIIHYTHAHLSSREQLCLSQTEKKRWSTIWSVNHCSSTMFLSLNSVPLLNPQTYTWHLSNSKYAMISHYMPVHLLKVVAFNSWQIS